MAELQIGKAGARRFALPLDMATQASAIVGVRGKGKTNTAVVMVEEILDQGVQVIVIDPTDVWWGLKSSRDGKRAGHPVVILGGARGDLPLAEGSGAAVADFAVENRVPMILSLRHLRKGAAQRFVQEFAEQLYHRKGEPQHRRPLLLVMDEASRFIPQRVGPEQARLVGAIEDIVRQGRSAGFGVALIDQRPASVNKDVLTQIELLVAHAVTSPQDRKALDEWVQGKDSAGHRAEFLKDLASLDRGEAWFWMPMADLFSRVHVRERRTFDSSRTPEIGEDPITPERFAQVDLGALQTALDAALQDAIANNPKTLKRRIRELEQEVAAAAPAGPSEEEVAARVTAALADAEAEWRAETERHVRNAVEALKLDARDALEALNHVLANGWQPPPIAARAPVAAPTAPRRLPPPAPRARPRAATPDEDERIGGTPQRMLDAMAMLAELGVHEPTQATIAGWVGISSETGTWRNYLSELRKHELVEDRPGKALALTEGGRARAQEPDATPTRRQLHDTWKSKMGGTQGRMLDVLIQAYPRPVTKEELGAAVGISPETGTFRNYLSDLRRPGIVRDVARGGPLVATELLFPKGLR